jgi:succinoglycan biosynthesis protein ExoW
VSAPHVGVVIPYFQSDAGLLQRTLRSVIAQEHRPFQVVVVDDGSPHPAVEELTPELRAALPQLTLIRQTNQGVSAARNAALHALRPEVDAIALLDSDDVWQPSHLRYAAEALSRGADFFFANSRVEGEQIDYFHEHPLHEQLYGSPKVTEQLAHWSGSLGALFSAGCAFRTPTVVFRRALMPEVRFPVEFRRAGEDQIVFWELLVRSAVIMFCTEVTLVYGGKGLGMWRNATLGTNENLIRVADELRLRRYVIAHYPVSGPDRELIESAIRARRSAALYSSLHLLRRRHNISREVLYLVRTDPLCVLSWSIGLPRMLCKWTWSRLRLHIAPH